MIFSLLKYTQQRSAPLTHQRGAALLHIDQQDLMTGSGKSDAQIDRGNRLADAALLIGEGHHLALIHYGFLLEIVIAFPGLLQGGLRAPPTD